ncbi:MAG: hypothetical protein CMF85_02940 [Candidatus Marinimicrobia bacterium]|nr:hypothetical protein [Candidatus Neomarinimicrobiota bacterium]
MKPLIIFVFFIVLNGCVGPAEPSHGLVENLPAVINKNDVFSFSLRADNFEYEKVFQTTISLENNKQLISTLVISDFTAGDSSYISVMGESDTLIYNYQINSNLVETEIKNHRTVNKVIVYLRGFSGIIDWVLTEN